MTEHELSLGEIWQAIRDGDEAVTAAFAIECLIMLLPFALLYGALR
ncbi:MAG: hypothetical protein AB7R40_23650 [Nitrospiraceae bacterium]